MDLDKETIKKIATLARLEIKESETDGLLKDMNNIIHFMEKLNEVDTTGVEPLVYMSDAKNITREDIMQTDINRTQAVQNAPDTDGQYFKVAKVIAK